LTNQGLLAKHIQNSLEWVNRIKECGRWKSQEVALAILRVVLHQLRDTLSVTEAVNFSAQFPLIIKGIFFEGWKPSHVPSKITKADSFLESIRRNLFPWGAIDPEDAVICVFRILVEKVDPGDIQKMRNSLPQELSELFEMMKK
jgi:uncharacterized protein (DUF2267 family)